MRVILKKGLTSKEFPEESRERAMQRAQHLAILHVCKYEVCDDVIYVRAEEYYQANVSRASHYS